MIMERKVFYFMIVIGLVGASIALYRDYFLLNQEVKSMWLSILAKFGIGAIVGLVIYVQVSTKWLHFIALVIVFLLAVLSLIAGILFSFVDSLPGKYIMPSFLIAIISIITGLILGVESQTACPECGSFLTEYGSHIESIAGHPSGLKASYRKCKMCGNQWGAYY
jgi:hypothetical protein